MKVSTTSLSPRWIAAAVLLGLFLLASCAPWVFLEKNANDESLSSSSSPLGHFSPFPLLRHDSVTNDINDARVVVDLVVRQEQEQEQEQAQVPPQEPRHSLSSSTNNNNNNSKVEMTVPTITSNAQTANAFRQLGKYENRMKKKKKQPTATFDYAAASLHTTPVTKGKSKGMMMMMKSTKKSMMGMMGMMMKKKSTFYHYHKDPTYRPRTIQAEVDVVCLPGDEKLSERIRKGKGKGMNRMMKSSGNKNGKMKKKKIVLLQGRHAAVVSKAPPATTTNNKSALECLADYGSSDDSD